MTKLSRGQVHIPRSPLAEQLHRTTELKREATELLRQLEESATGQPVAKPGHWRHHPNQWCADHPER